MNWRDGDDEVGT